MHDQVEGLIESILNFIQTRLGMLLTLLVIAGGGHHPLVIAFGSHFNLDGANWL